MFMVQLFKLKVTIVMEKFLYQKQLQVRQLDWVEQVWPADLKNLQTSPTNDLNKMMYPKVQKYVCMSATLVHHGGPSR